MFSFSLDPLNHQRAKWGSSFLCLCVCLCVFVRCLREAKGQGHHRDREMKTVTLKIRIFPPPFGLFTGTGWLLIVLCLSFRGLNKRDTHTHTRVSSGSWFAPQVSPECDMRVALPIHGTFLRISLSLVRGSFAARTLLDPSFLHQFLRPWPHFFVSCPNIGRCGRSGRRDKPGREDRTQDDRCGHVAKVKALCGIAASSSWHRVPGWPVGRSFINFYFCISLDSTSAKGKELGPGPGAACRGRLVSGNLTSAIVRPLESSSNSRRSSRDKKPRKDRKQATQKVKTIGMNP